MEKISRTDQELINALQDQLHILKEAIDKVKIGDFAFAKVIAAVLRVLVIKTTKNKPLLLNMSKKYNFPLIIKRDVPSFKNSTILIQDMLNDLYFASNVNNVRMTNREFITNFAQQQGLSHEDTSLDRDFVISKSTGFLWGGLPAETRGIVGLGECVHRAGSGLLTELLKQSH